MDNAGTSLLILGLGDPHGLESGKRTENGSSNPDKELTLSRSHDLDLHGGGSESSDLLAETLRNAWVHSCSTAHHDVVVKILADVHVALQNRLVGDLVETGHFLTNQHGLEESLRASETLTADSDGLAVGKLINLIILG